MVTDNDAAGWWRRPLLGEGIAGWDAVLTAVLSLLMVLLVATPPAAKGPLYVGPLGHAGTAVAALFALAMTVPVLWRRRAPVAAAAALAGAALANWLLVGELVRCGLGLPALFLVAYATGRARTGRFAALGLLLCWGAAAAQAFGDPNLQPGMTAPLIVLSSLFFGAGRLVTSRQAMVARLRERNGELREQRERNAALAVAADRARIATDLGGVLRDRLGDLADTAAAGHAAADPAAAGAALSRVESLGRDTLGQMRDVVGGLRTGDAPQPVLAELSALLARATRADARLRVHGTPVSLPAGVELSGYRVVEHLLEVMADDPQARVDVDVTFAETALEVSVTGPARKDKPDTALLAARQRVDLHGGTMTTRTSRGRREAFVRLPVGAAATA